VGTDPQKIIAAADRILAGSRSPFAVPDLWDGKASTRIVDVLLTHFLPKMNLATNARMFAP